MPAQWSKPRVFAFFLFFLLPFSLFCQRIVSPVEGIFANLQPLVINLEEDEEAFYSYSSSENRNDPLDSGFVYDSPVLIDLTGNVILKIAVVSPSKLQNLDSNDDNDKIERYEIRYKVQGNPNPFEQGSSESSFVARITRGALVSLPSGSSLEIPSSLKYSFDDKNSEKNYLPGKALYLSFSNCLSRLVPCSVTDRKSVWRFVISARGRSSESLIVNSDFPFKITDWEKIEFTGKNLIYQVDDEYWSDSKKPFAVDRSVPHVLRWQNVAYEKENPVEAFTLPPKPELEKFYDNGAAVFSLKNDDDYKIRIKNYGLESEKQTRNQNDFLYNQVVFDVFDGEEISGKADFEIYLDGVLQGKISENYDVDKKPPLPPIFDASSSGFYTRSDVNLKISAEYGADIFYASSGPHSLASGTYSENSPALEKYSLSNFKPYDFKTFLLRSGKKSAVFYKIAAYAVDSVGNKSEISEYKLIIDKFNYFIDFGSATQNPDGSGARPFNKMEQVLNVINSSDYAHFFVTGDFVFSGGETLIKSNCAFTGTGSKKSKIAFLPDSYLTVKNSSISFANVVIEKTFLGAETSESRMIGLENAAADFDSCQIYGNFSENGILINSSSSVVNFNSSSVSAKSSSYVCLVSALDSEINAENCNLNAVSQACAALSISSSSLDLENSAIKVFCHLGRIIESEKSNLKMNKNNFQATFDEKKTNQNAIYKDEKTLVIEDSENKTEIKSK